MRIAALSLPGDAGWPSLNLKPISTGLNVVYGPPRSGKSTAAELLAHALFGKPPVPSSIMGQMVAPTGEVDVEGGKGQYRVRRHQEPSGTIRLTVASLDGASADAGTVHKLMGGLSPRVLSPLCAVGFRESPYVGRLLCPEFARACNFIRRDHVVIDSRRTAELAARRDLLAQELEKRIAGERRVSKELETRWRELDRIVGNEEQQIGTLEQRFLSVETSLAETDARLRYRRLELNADQQWHVHQLGHWQTPLAELDEQIQKWRRMLSELAQRESSVRARLADVQPSRAAGKSSIANTRAWLAISRQLATDLAGEVSRLARASGSDHCVCRDAHPRLRPIVETLERQFDLLESLAEAQHRAIHASELRIELDRLAGSQEELRRHVDHLLDRRQALAASAASVGDEAGDSRMHLSAADAEQLESRRMDLEHERCELLERVQSHARVLREAREQRESIDRERAALLSARSIEHVQRELAEVQSKLERAAGSHEPLHIAGIFADCAADASEFLAKLTDGDLVQLFLGENGLDACVSNRAGETFPVELLAAAHRDQVYLSLCLALLQAAGRQGLWLPLVLDEPFERLNARGAASLATVLGDFCRQGHQVLVFTSQREATNRLASLGATVHDILNSRGKQLTFSANPAPRPTAQGPSMGVKRRPAKRRKSVERSTKVRTSPPSNDEESANANSDAA
jgi:energy-coupling factor transporter ATP-binding protein EcfA2